MKQIDRQQNRATYRQTNTAILPPGSIFLTSLLVLVSGNSSQSQSAENNDVTMSDKSISSAHAMTLAKWRMLIAHK